MHTTINPLSYLSLTSEMSKTTTKPPSPTSLYIKATLEEYFKEKPVDKESFESLATEEERKKETEDIMKNFPKFRSLPEEEKVKYGWKKPKPRKSSGGKRKADEEEEEDDDVSASAVRVTPKKHTQKKQQAEKGAFEVWLEENPLDLRFMTYESAWFTAVTKFNFLPDHVKEEYQKKANPPIGTGTTDDPICLDDLPPVKQEKTQGEPKPSEDKEQSNDKDKSSKDKPSKDKSSKDKSTKEKPSKDKSSKDKSTKDKPSKDKPSKEKKRKDRDDEPKPIKDKPSEDKPSKKTKQAKTVSFDDDQDNDSCSERSIASYYEDEQDESSSPPQDIYEQVNRERDVSSNPQPSNNESSCPPYIQREQDIQSEQDDHDFAFDSTSYEEQEDFNEEKAEKDRKRQLGLKLIGQIETDASVPSKIYDLFEEDFEEAIFPFVRASKEGKKSVFSAQKVFDSIEAKYGLPAGSFHTRKFADGEKTIKSVMLAVINPKAREISRKLTDSNLSK